MVIIRHKFGRGLFGGLGAVSALALTGCDFAHTLPDAPLSVTQAPPPFERPVSTAQQPTELAATPVQQTPPQTPQTQAPRNLTYVPSEPSIAPPPTFPVAQAEPAAPVVVAAEPIAPVVAPMVVAAEPVGSAIDAYPVASAPLYESDSYSTLYQEAPIVEAPTVIEQQYDSVSVDYAYAEPIAAPIVSAEPVTVDVAYAEPAPMPSFPEAAPIVEAGSINFATPVGVAAPVGVVETVPLESLSFASAPPQNLPRLRDPSARAVYAPSVAPDLSAERTVRLAGGVAALPPISGAPADRSAALIDSIVSRLGGSAGGSPSRRLEGLAILSTGAVTLYWRLLDAGGAQLRSASFSAAYNGSGWGGVSGANLNSIAEQTAVWLQGSPAAPTIAAAPQISAPVSQPTLALLPEPPRFRPTRAAAPAPIVSQPVRVAAAPVQPLQVDPLPAPTPVATAAPSVGGGERPVYFRGVFGAPGEGDRELGREVRGILRENGVRTTSAESGDAIYLSADVSKRANGSSDHIRIVWRVTDAAGREIGQVVQENDVPAGSLDGDWGRDAYYAAMGAREGILQLVALGGES